MSKDDLTPFLKWGSFKSTDQNNPDVLEMQISDAETFETAYSINAKVLQKVSGEWKEVIVPLKSHESKNSILLKEWQKNARKDLLRAGKKFLLKTWLGKSTKSDHPIRRFILEFL